jgi:hypothetical protein
MALSELAALEAAYQVLQPLDAAGRRRALQWLSDALGAEAPLPKAAGAEATEDAQVAEVAAEPKARSAPAAATPRRTRRGAKAAAPAATPATRSRRTRSARQSAVAPAESEGRAYRRMPAAEEVLAAYRQVGSVSGLADHFGVPRYTVQGWARQLRRQGHTIGRSR